LHRNEGCSSIEYCRVGFGLLRALNQSKVRVGQFCSWSSTFWT